VKQRYSPRIHKDDLFRLLAKARQDGSCWVWTAAQLPSGYGCFRFRGRQTYAHRASYALHHGEIPDGYYVMHECDRPACINPCHLRAVKPRENTADMLAKGRHRTRARFGAEHHNSRLTLAMVEEIRSSKETQTALAIKFGVTHSVIGRARRGETYK
jgi:hypothetical protein